jgi:hypothetical protein
MCLKGLLLLCSFAARLVQRPSPLFFQVVIVHLHKVVLARMLQHISQPTQYIKRRNQTYKQFSYPPGETQFMHLLPASGGKKLPGKVALK